MNNYSFPFHFFLHHCIPKRAFDLTLNFTIVVHGLILIHNWPIREQEMGVCGRWQADQSESGEGVYGNRMTNQIFGSFHHVGVYGIYEGWMWVEWMLCDVVCLWSQFFRWVWAHLCLFSSLNFKVCSDNVCGGWHQGHVSCGHCKPGDQCSVSMVSWPGQNHILLSPHHLTQHLKHNRKLGLTGIVRYK